MLDTKNENISFTLVNPFLLRDYTIDIPLDAKVWKSQPSTF